MTRATAHRIRRAATADGIEHDENRAGHGRSYWLTIPPAVASMRKAAANKARV